MMQKKAQCIVINKVRFHERRRACCGERHSYHYAVSGLGIFFYYHRAVFGRMYSDSIRLGDAAHRASAEISISESLGARKILMCRSGHPMKDILRSDRVGSIAHSGRSRAKAKPFPGSLAATVGPGPQRSFAKSSREFTLARKEPSLRNNDRHNAQLGAIPVSAVIRNFTRG